LTGLSELKIIAGNLEIEGNDNLVKLSGLEGLEKIGGDLSITNNINLSYLNPLSNINSIDGNLFITYNPLLTSLYGLQNIDPGLVEDIYIVFNDSLSYCDIFSICQYIANPGGTIQIYGNAPGCNNLEEVIAACATHCLPDGISIISQVQIDSFQVNYPGCVDVMGDVWIHGGNDITGLNGLNVITSIGGTLNISHNQDLTSLNGLDNVSVLGKSLQIYQNKNITSLSGLDNIYSIGSNLQIENNDSLVSLEGLDNLNSIGGSVKIYHSDALISLENLNNLYFIGGYLRIYNNDNLVSLAGLENVESGTINDLVIKYNSSLAMCAVQSICDYLAAPSGIIEIHNNAPGCNSPEEVEDACWTSVDVLDSDDLFNIIPNPFELNTVISYALNCSSHITIIISDLSGRSVLTLTDEHQQQGKHEQRFYLEGLNPGIYFFTLKTNEGILTKKIIKL
jgi:hypothetical protein